MLLRTLSCLKTVCFRHLRSEHKRRDTKGVTDSSAVLSVTTFCVLSFCALIVFGNSPNSVFLNGVLSADCSQEHAIPVFYTLVWTTVEMSGFWRALFGFWLCTWVILLSSLFNTSGILMGNVTSQRYEFICGNKLLLQKKKRKKRGLCPSAEYFSTFGIYQRIYQTLNLLSLILTSLLEFVVCPYFN